MDFVAQRAMVAIIFHSWSRRNASVSQYFPVCSLPLLVGEGLPAGRFQHVCGVLTLAMHAEAVVMLWTRDVDPSCTFFQLICILCEHRRKGTLTWPCRIRWNDRKNSKHGRKENQKNKMWKMLFMGSKSKGLPLQTGWLMWRFARVYLIVL